MKFAETALYAFFVLLCSLARPALAENAKPGGEAYAALWLYSGSWRITPANHAPGAKPDELTNECSLVGKYFACQQTVNGKIAALIVFIPTGTPGHFYTQSIMPEGRATGRDDLDISGDRWTYSSRRQDGAKVTHYRTTNVFTGKNKIHFEQSESTDGTEWSVKNSGDEVRTFSRTSTR